MTKEQAIAKLEQVQDKIWDLEMGSLQHLILRKQWEELCRERNELRKIIRRLEEVDKRKLD